MPAENQSRWEEALRTITRLEEKIVCLEIRLAEADRRYEQRHQSTEQAVMKAETAVREKLLAMNEFRDQLTDQAATFLTRTEYAARHDDLTNREQINSSRIDKIEARKEGVGSTFSYAVGVVGIVVGIICALAAGIVFVKR